jgi:hypothetical protein
MTKLLKFNVYGRQVPVEKSTQGWTALEIEQYLADLCHEWASEQHPHVTPLD